MSSAEAGTMACSPEAFWISTNNMHACPSPESHPPQIKAISHSRMFEDDRQIQPGIFLSLAKSIAVTVLQPSLVVGRSFGERQPARPGLADSTAGTEFGTARTA